MYGLTKIQKVFKNSILPNVKKCDINVTSGIFMKRRLKKNKSPGRTTFNQIIIFNQKRNLMKKTLALFATLVVLVFACKKDDHTTPKSQSNSVEELINSVSDEVFPEFRDVEDVTVLATELINGESCERYNVSMEQTPSKFILMNPMDGAYPGSKIQGGYANYAPVTLITAKSGGGEIILSSAFTGTKMSSVWLPEINHANVIQAINDLISNQTESLSARASISIHKVRSQKEFTTIVGANVGFLNFGSDFKFYFDTNDDVTHYLVQIKQVFYTIQYERPPVSSEIFSPEVTVEDLEPYVWPGNPPAYISSVSYGSIFYALFSSKVSADSLSASINAHFVFGGANSSIEYVSELDEVSMQAMALGGDEDILYNAIQSSGELENFLSTIKESTDMSKAVPLSYTVRSVKSNKVVRQQILTEFETQECTPYSSPLKLSREIIDYGEICGGVNIKKLFIKNADLNNEVNLEISGPVISGVSNTNRFNVEPQGSFTLQPNEVLEVYVRFKACHCLLSLGCFDCELTTDKIEILWDGGSEFGEIEIPLRGSGIHPDDPQCQ